MLKILVPAREWFEPEKGIFHVYDEVEIVLEHSLLSLSKWESKWKKPFLSDNNKTQLEVLDYINCMCTNMELDSDILNNLTQANFESINQYIGAQLTATTITTDKRKGPNKIITSEVIYGWMVSLNIPFVCENWHLSRLITLINVCSESQKEPKKMSKSEAAARNRELNAQRRKAMNTRG